MNFAELGKTLDELKALQSCETEWGRNSARKGQVTPTTNDATGYKTQLKVSESALDMVTALDELNTALISPSWNVT